MANRVIQSNFSFLLLVHTPPPVHPAGAVSYYTAPSCSTTSAGASSSSDKHQEMTTTSSFHKSIYMNVIWNCWDTEKTEEDNDCANWIAPYSRNSQCLKPSLRLLMVLQPGIWLCMLQPTQTWLCGGSIYTLCDKGNKNLRVQISICLSWDNIVCHWETPVTKNSFCCHCLESKARLLILSPRCLQYNIVLAVIPLDSSHYIKPTKDSKFMLAFMPLSSPDKTTSSVIFKGLSVVLHPFASATASQVPKLEFSSKNQTCKLWLYRVQLGLRFPKLDLKEILS